MTHDSPTPSGSAGRGLASDGSLRICMPSFSFLREVYRTGLREAQDVLASCASVDTVDLSTASDFSWKERLYNRLAYHSAYRFVRGRNPGIRPARLTSEYDVFIAVCPFWRDVAYLNAIEGWRDRCKLSICWIDELWSKEVGELEHWLPILNQFDHVFVGLDGTAQTLSSALSRPCHDLPAGVDAIRFAPMPIAPDRVIDVYSVGRRVDTVHQGLRSFTSRKGLFYLYDTTQGGDLLVHDHRSHRDMYANLVKRSRLFMIAPAKVDMQHHTGGQTDIGFRCFEGAAGGAVLVGQAAESDLFRRLFDWQDAVVRIEADGSDATEVIENLLRDPERRRLISARNVEQSLRRHDWVYRWRQIFETVGLVPTAGMDQRIERLGAMANSMHESVT